MVQTRPGPVLALAIVFAACAPASSITSSPTSHRAFVPPAPATAPSAAIALADASATPVSRTPTLPEELVAVAELGFGVQVAEIDGTVLAFSDWNNGTSGVRMGILDGDRFVEKPDLALTGPYLSIVGVAGKWPEGVDLLVASPTTRTMNAEHWVLGTGGWVRKQHQQSKAYLGIAKVSDGVVALEVEAFNFRQRPKEALTPLRGSKVVRSFMPLDKACATKIVDEQGISESMVSKTRMSHQAIGATASGKLIALGIDHCSDQPAIEVWEPGQTSSRVVALPGPKLAVVEYSDVAVRPGRGADEAWIVFGGEYHFDGKDVSARSALPNGVRFSAVGPKGSLYAVTLSVDEHDHAQNRKVIKEASRLFKTEGDEWRELALPADPESFAGDRSGTVWMSAGRKLYRTKKFHDERSIASGPGGSDAGQRPPPRRAPSAPGPLCPSLVVVLYTFSKVTPDDYDFPATRKALKGHRELEGVRFVVAREGSQRFLSAIVKDKKTAVKLGALIEREVAGAKPQLVCAEPEIVREVKINLATGEIVP